MFSTNYDINKIEVALKNVIVAGNISKKVFTGNRPSMPEDKSPDDFVVISVSSTLSDLSAYGRCVCAIDIFCKNLPNGCKNGGNMSIITQKARTIFPIKHDDYLFNSEPNIIPMGSDGFGYHVERIQIQLLIKSI